MKLKSIILVVLVALLSLSLIACNGIKKKDAKEMAEAFLVAVENGDFESARSYLHPEKPFDLERYFNGIEEREGIDFQKGIEIKRYVDYSSSLYDSDVKGSDYELEMNIIVDGVGFEFSVDIVKNDLGYGIYEIDIDR